LVKQRPSPIRPVRPRGDRRGRRVTRPRTTHEGGRRGSEEMPSRLETGIRPRAGAAELVLHAPLFLHFLPAVLSLWARRRRRPSGPESLRAPFWCKNRSGQITIRAHTYTLRTGVRRPLRRSRCSRPSSPLPCTASASRNCPWTSFLHPRTLDTNPGFVGVRHCRLDRRYLRQGAAVPSWHDGVRPD
jgi:hypothetical protein